MTLVTQRPGVLIVDADIVRLGREEVAILKASMAGTPKGRARICAHRASTDDLHEMLIAMPRGTYIRPHKHLEKPESFHVVEGIVDVILFEDDGLVREVARLGTAGTDHPFYQRLADPVYHSLLIRSDVLVVHETTRGPFRSDGTLFAPWAPPEEEGEAGLALLERACAGYTRLDAS